MTFAFDIITHSALVKKFKVSTAWKVPVFGAILVRIFPHSDWIRMRENADQNNSEYQHFLRSEIILPLDLTDSEECGVFYSWQVKSNWTRQ